MFHFELVQVFQRAQQGDLYKIVGVVDLPGARREAAVGPTPEQRQVAPHQTLARIAIAGADALQQGDCR